MGILGYSVASLDKSLFHGASVEVCSTESDEHLVDSKPLISMAYQENLRKQPALSGNLISNADLMTSEPTSNAPVGFGRTIEGDTTTYQFMEDTDKSRFLRVIDRREGLPVNDTRPAWLLPQVSAIPQKTYVYSFQYRSGVPAELVTESADTNGTRQYHSVTTLPATSVWRTFTGHLDNLEDVQAFRPILTATKPGYVDMKGFDVHRVLDAALPEGMVTVTFDDGWESVSNAIPLLQRYDIRTSQYIISDVAGSNLPEYMSFSSIEKLKKAGHEIGSHSLRHCNQTRLNPQELQDNATQSKQLLEEKGVGPIRSFAYPLGQYDEFTQAVYERRFTYIRTSDAGYNSRYFDVANIHSMGVLDRTTDEQFKTWLDFAKTYKQWVVLVYHRVNESGPYSVTTDQLERQLLLIKESGLKVLPLSEAADTIRNN
jgi:peptidoglycan/xylan/chitin deacetylase (PgdA/CDA1 family)